MADPYVEARQTFRRRNAPKDHKFLSSGIQTEFLRPTVSRVPYPSYKTQPDVGGISGFTAGGGARWPD